MREETDSVRRLLCAVAAQAVEDWAASERLLQRREMTKAERAAIPRAVRLGLKLLEAAGYDPDAAASRIEAKLGRPIPRPEERRQQR